MSSASTTAAPESAAALWVGSWAAARIIARTPNTVRRLAREGRVRVHAPPGLYPKYFLPDLEKLAPPKIDVA